MPSHKAMLIATDIWLYQTAGPQRHWFNKKSIIYAWADYFEPWLEYISALADYRDRDIEWFGGIKSHWEEEKNGN